jgi:glycosyltransferase involved in cell wall biosynthesis
MEICITIPAYNEEETIGSVISKIKKVMEENKYNYKILVIDDGSKDNTAKIAKELGAIVFSHQKNNGLAETFRTEMKKAIELNPDIIVHIDADNQYIPSEIPNLIKPIIDKKADIVLGSRFKGKIESMPLIKRLGNKAFSKVISNITKTKISDGQTGFRAFTKEVAKMNIQSDHTYTQEQIIKAVKNKFRLTEVPAYFAKRKDKSRLMKNPFDYAIKAWVNILRVYRDYEPLRFFGYFGGAFITIGLLLGIWILITLLKTGGVGGIPRVILSALFIMTGVQIMLFGFLADMNRK